MKSLKIIFFGLSIVFTACTASMQPMALTATGEHRQLMERMALSHINLEPLSFQPGDLPESYKTGTASYRYANDLPKPTEPLEVLTQKVGQNASDGYKDDYVMITIFESEEDLTKAYTETLSYFNAVESSPASVGKRSAFAAISDSPNEAVFIYMNCKLFVVIRIKGSEVNEEFLAAYAQKINERISPWYVRHKIFK